MSYYDQLTDLGIKLTKRNGQEKVSCPKCYDGRKNKNKKDLSVNITTGDYCCFGIETKVITKQGVKEIGEILGKSVFVLNGNGKWSKVIFKPFGQQRLFKIKLKRFQSEKVVYATGNHRWFVDIDYSRPYRVKSKEVTTLELKQNQRLTGCFPNIKIDKSENNVAVVSGTIYGDGMIYNRHRENQFSRIVLYGEKKNYLSRFFSDNNTKTLCGYSPEFKQIPSIGKNENFLYNWLKGYFATDGDMSKGAVPHITSASLSSLILVKDIFIKCGISIQGIYSYWRKGIRDKYSYIHCLSLAPQTMTDDFFINPNHKKNFKGLSLSTKQRWKVVDVVDTDRIETVFCCEEPKTHSFALDGNILTGNCHNDQCDFKGNVRTKENHERKNFILPDQNTHVKQSLSIKAIQWFGKRSISKPTLERYMIYGKKEFMPQTGKEESCVCFPYFKNGKLVNIKFRDGKKRFKMVKDAELSLFGLQFLRGRKHILFTEGEIDTLALAECGYGHDEGQTKNNVDTETGEIEEVQITKQKSKWCPVSVPNGASDKGEMKLEYLDNCFEQLIDISEFIIAVDDDVAGRRLKDELIRRLGIERCRFITYPKNDVVVLDNNLTRPCKDLNEVLQYLGKDAVVNCIENAQFTPIEGVYYLPDLYPNMLEKFKKGILMGETTRMGLDVDAHFRWKRGDVNIGIGYGNWGKTLCQNQLELTKSIYDGWKWGIFCPENYPADDFYDDLVEPFVGKPLDRMSDEEYGFACKFIGDHFFYVYPEDDHDLTSIFERFRNLILKKGIDGGRIDPYNQLDKEHSQWGMTAEERLSIDLKKCKRFALYNQMVINILAHPKNPTYNADKSLPVVDMYDIAGGAQWGNKADTIWSLYRPNWHIDKEDPSIELHFQKIKRKRTGGKLGVVHMSLNNETKRYQMMNSQEPCDPRMAEKIKRAENYQEGISTPLFSEDLDDDDTKLPF